MVEYSKHAAEILKSEGIDAAIYNMRFIKPLDDKLLAEVASNYNKIITVEENSIIGGFGSGVLEHFNEQGYKNEILRVGLPDKFIDHGTQAELHEILGIDPKGIAIKTAQFLNNEITTKGIKV